MSEAAFFVALTEFCSFLLLCSDYFSLVRVTRFAVGRTNASDTCLSGLSSSASRRRRRSIVGFPSATTPLHSSPSQGDSRLFDVMVIPMRSLYVHLGLAGTAVRKPSQGPRRRFFDIPSITRDLGPHRASRMGAVRGCVHPECRDRIKSLTPLFPSLSVIRSEFALFIMFTVLGHVRFLERVSPHVGSLIYSSSRAIGYRLPVRPPPCSGQQSPPSPAPW